MRQFLLNVASSVVALAVCVGLGSLLYAGLVQGPQLTPSEAVSEHKLDIQSSEGHLTALPPVTEVDDSIDSLAAKLVEPTQVMPEPSDELIENLRVKLSNTEQELTEAQEHLDEWDSWFKKTNEYLKRRGRAQFVRVKK